MGEISVIVDLLLMVIALLILILKRMTPSARDRGYLTVLLWMVAVAATWHVVRG
jgi:hypothetical protein